MLHVLGQNPSLPKFEGKMVQSSTSSAGSRNAPPRLCPKDFTPSTSHREESMRLITEPSLLRTPEDHPLLGPSSNNFGIQDLQAASADQNSWRKMQQVAAPPKNQPNGFLPFAFQQIYTMSTPYVDNQLSPRANKKHNWLVLSQAAVDIILDVTGSAQLLGRPLCS